MLDLILAESADVLAAAHEWNEQRAAWRREWLHDLAVGAGERLSSNEYDKSYVR